LKLQGSGSARRAALPALLGCACATIIACVAAGAAAQDAPVVVPTESTDAAQAVCVTPDAMARLNGSLPSTTRRFKAGQPITIVAVGSSSTFGHGASKDIYKYPTRLGEELLKRWPRHIVTVVNKGISGEDVDENLLRLQKDVLDAKPQLVIWQIGTNALLRHEDPQHFRTALQKGISLIKATGADLILMDLQFAPKVSEASGYQSMLDLFDAIGKRNQVPVFHRFALMHYWSKSMQDQYQDMVYEDGLHMTDRSYGCLATVLADAIAYSVSPTPARAKKLEAARR
jgi:lysophospholipase L1-like esterase